MSSNARQDRNTMPPSIKALVLFQQFAPVPGRPAFYCAYSGIEKALSVKGLTNVTFPSPRDGKGNAQGNLDHIVPDYMKEYPKPDNVHNLQYITAAKNQEEKNGSLPFHAKFELLRREVYFPRVHDFHQDIATFVESCRRGRPIAYWPFWAYRADGTPRLWGYSLKEKRFVVSPEESYFLEVRSKAARVCAAVDALPGTNIIAQMVLEEFEKQYGVDPYEIKQDDLI